MTSQFLHKYKVLFHVLFWILYYVSFSLIWVRDNYYYQSFSLEFALMPVRIALSYYTIYYLIPVVLKEKRVLYFFAYYGLALLIAGSVQRLITFYFYESFFQIEAGLWDASAWFKSVLLVNSTAVLLSCIKLYLLWQESLASTEKNEQSHIFIKADKRIHKIKLENILYIEGLGNYLQIYLEEGDKLISYHTLKEFEKLLPDTFVRPHKSYIINTDKINYFTKENIKIGDKLIPISKKINFVEVLNYN